MSEKNFNTNGTVEIEPFSPENKIINLESLTPQEKVLTLLQLGNSWRTALEFANVPMTVYSRWMKDEKFAEKLRKAKVIADIFDTEVIRKAASNEWQAAAFRMKLRESARKKQNLSVKINTPAECKKLLQKVISLMLSDDLEVEKARAVGFLINCTMNVIEKGELLDRLKNQEEKIRLIEETMQK